jgi:hypothetical protein
MAAISGQPPFLAKLDRTPNASPEAAIAAASREVLLKMVPDQKAATEDAYTAALAKLPDAGKDIGTRLVIYVTHRQLKRAYPFR